MLVSIEPMQNSSQPTISSNPIALPLAEAQHLSPADLSNATLPAIRQQPPEQNQSLTQSMISAMTSAKRAFAFARFEKALSADETRTIIIAGESHIKSQTASKAGQELLKAFPVRGLEGATMDQTICDRIVHFSLLPYLLIARAATKGLTSINGRGLAGSTISDARDIEAETHSTSTSTSNTPTLNIHLEAGGLRPTILGEVSKLAFAAISVIPSLALLKFVCSPIPVLSLASADLQTFALKYLRPIIDFTIFGGLVASLLPKSVRENIILRPIIRVLDIRNEWVLNQRNDLMVKNLLEHVEKGERKEPVLAIVGAMHIGGMAEKLESKGWKRVEEEVG